jgi:hypothetical protein
MFKNYTIQDVLDEVDIIECYEQSGQKLRMGEVIRKQSTLYELLGVKPPTTL